MAPEGTTVPVGNVVAWIGKPGEKVDGDGAPAPAKPAPAAAAPAGKSPAPAPVPVAAAADATRVKASPLAKRIAKEVGVDLKLVQGSGPGGRVIKRDVEGAPASPAASVAAPAPRTTPDVRRTGVPYEDVPLTQIRKTIAKRLAASIGPIPHFFLTTDVTGTRYTSAWRSPSKTASSLR